MDFYVLGRLIIVAVMGILFKGSLAMVIQSHSAKQLQQDYHYPLYMESD